MDALLYNYGSLIDKIRKDRNLTRQELCDDIMSVRNYQRFASNEISISNDKIIKLIDRLGLDYFTFYDIYKSNDGDKFNGLRKAYGYAINWQFEEAEKELNKIDESSLTSYYNNQMYTFTKVFMKKYYYKTATANTYRTLEKAIDYPNIFLKKILNLFEINALITLNAEKIKSNNTEIIDFFMELVKLDLHSYGIPSKAISSIYASLSKNLFKLDRFEETILYSDLGIKFCKDNHLATGLINLYGYKVLAQHRLGKTKESMETTTLMYALLFLEESDEKKNVYIEIIERNTGYKYNDYLLSVKKNDGN
jgi:transcriptional regulator with XRE-family HTH domain